METSLIVRWLTPDLGRIATVAKGARRPKSPFLGKLDLFYVVDFSFGRSRRSELHTLREVSLRENHAGLRRELGCLQQAAYCAAFIEQATETETPLVTPFELLSGLLDYLAHHPPQPQTVFAFELKLLDELGLRPDLTGDMLTPGTRHILGKLGGLEWQDLPRLKLSASQVHETQEFLQDFLVLHLGRIPPGRLAAVSGASHQ